jgi:prepilin-type N-terminal cleavage/methylation domain-containing protein
MIRGKSRKGFTLVEIMIVVAIIGILASIAFSNIQIYRNRAITRACISNLRDIDNNVSLWAINNGKNGTDAVTMQDLVPACLRTTPYCPLDSAKQGYALTTVSEKPTCSADPTNHKLD